MILDPVGLFGEGQYNLLSLKEISVTDSFRGLDKKTRHCQNVETYDDCKTRLYIEHLRQECECLPLSLRLSDKAKLKELTKHFLKYSVTIIVYLNLLYRMLCVWQTKKLCVAKPSHLQTQLLA